MIRNSSGKTTTMETVSPSQTQICPVSTSDSFWCVVPFCCSLLSAVVRQHLSHSARGIYDLGIKQLSYANLVVDQSKSLSSPTKNAVFAAISTLSWRLCHWNRETLSNSTAILSWKQQQLSWEKKSAAKIWKQNPFIHSFIHSFLQKPPFVRRHLPPYEVFSDDVGRITILHLSVMIVVKKKTWNLVKFY